MAPAKPGVRSHYRQPGPCLMLHCESPLRDAPPTLTPLRPALARSGSASRDSSSRRARDPVKHRKRRQSLENNPRWAGSPGGPRRPTLAFSQEGAPAAPRFFGPGRMPRPEVRRGTHQAEGASGTGSDSWLPGGGEAGGLRPHPAAPRVSWEPARGRRGGREGASAQSLPSPETPGISKMKNLRSRRTQIIVP